MGQTHTQQHYLNCHFRARCQGLGIFLFLFGWGAYVGMGTQYCLTREWVGFTKWVSSICHYRDTIWRLYKRRKAKGGRRRREPGREQHGDDAILRSQRLCRIVMARPDGKEYRTSGPVVLNRVTRVCRGFLEVPDSRFRRQKDIFKGFRTESDL